MSVHIITPDQVDSDLYYIGPELTYKHILAQPDLGQIRFKSSIKAESIQCGHKTGISVDGNITVTENINVGCGIKATGTISAWGDIKSGAGILAEKYIKVYGEITAERSIISYGDIKAHYINSAEGIFSAGFIEATDIISARSIRAGEYILAVGLVKANKSIHAGTYIDCSTLFAGLRIFAGICSFHLPSDDEKEIRCHQLQHGTIEYGRLVLK